MVKTEVVRALGGLRPYFDGNEDMDFNFRLAELGELGNLTGIHYGYRKHDTNTVHRIPYTCMVNAIAAATGKRIRDLPLKNQSLKI